LRSSQPRYDIDLYQLFPVPQGLCCNAAKREAIMTVFTTNVAHAAPSLTGLRNAVADFLTGFGNGYRAYRIYSELDAKSDSALAAMNLTRADLPGIAARAFARSR
jgi:hypothetical protein